jgi:eukaryotic-like serine/threonine-protein kinase
LSADGRVVTFNESGVGGGPTSAFVRKTDGSPAIRLAEGAAAGISPDGSSVLVAVDDHKSLKIVPIGTGQARRLDTGNLRGVGQFAEWTADGTSVVFVASEPGRPRRIFVVSIAGGSPRPVTPEGVAWVGSLVVSPDSRYVLGRDAQSKILRYPLDGGAPLPLGGLEPGDVPLRWSADGRSIWLLGRDRSPARIFRLIVETGRRALWREIVDSDPAGLSPGWLRVLISADGTSYVYGYRRTLSDLYVADGIK